jgi:hypothetical protein
VIPKTLQALFHQEGDEVLDAVGVAPLVVVPADDLAGVLAYYLGQFAVDDAAEGVALEVGGDEFFVGETENAFEFAIRGLLEGFVDRLVGDGLLGDEGEVDYGDVGGRDADGETVEFAVHRRHDELKGFGGAGARRNHAEGGGAGAAEVLVRGVEDDLVVGIAVDGGHDSRGDAEGIVKHFDDGSETVGGATGVRDDVVLGGIVLIVVDAEDDGDVLVSGRGGDDDLLDGGTEVSFCLLGVGEKAGGFYDDLGADGGPVEFGGVTLGEDLDLFTVHSDEVGSVGDLVFQVAEDGVIFEEMGQGGGGGEVVDGYEFNVWVADSAAEDVASDPAEAVDAYLYCCHDFGCSCRVAARYLRVLTLEHAAKSLAHTISDAITGVRAAQMLMP